MSNFVIFCILIGIQVLAYTIGYMVTGLHLEEKSDFFAFKPFRCHPCCTGHISWILGLGFGLYIDSLTVAIVAPIMSVILTYLMVKSDEELQK